MRRVRLIFVIEYISFQSITTRAGVHKYLRTTAAGGKKGLTKHRQETKAVSQYPTTLN